MSADPQVVVVHPDDVNLADVKAAAARYGASVIANPYTPRGTAFLIKEPRFTPPGSDDAR